MASKVLGNSRGVGSLWNPNSYHWEETNHTKFSIQLLEHLFKSISIDCGDATCHIKEVRYVRGDSAVNIRRGKKIAIFELEAQLRWEGYSKLTKKKSKGTVDIPSIVPEDVEDDEFEVHISGDSGPAATLMRDKGRRAIYAAVRSFLKRLMSIGNDHAAIIADKSRRIEAKKKTDEAIQLKGKEKLAIEEKIRQQEAEILGVSSMETERKAALLPLKKTVKQKSNPNPTANKQKKTLTLLPPTPPENSQDIGDKISTISIENKAFVAAHSAESAASKLINPSPLFASKISQISPTEKTEKTEKSEKSFQLVHFQN